MMWLDIFALATIFILLFCVIESVRKAARSYQAMRRFEITTKPTQQGKS